MKKTKSGYFHKEIPELTADFIEEGFVRIGSGGDFSNSEALSVCLNGMKLGLRIGIISPSKSKSNDISYNDGTDTLVFKTPLISGMVSKKMCFLRGWKYFESCVKGFNTLGLMGWHVQKQYSKLLLLSHREIIQLKTDFLLSRKDSKGKKIFTSAAISKSKDGDWLEISLTDLAIWMSFGKRTIFCSTSTNMGISTHQALRLMQNTELKFNKKSFKLLNNDEGKLVIWAPDERADFMNDEKSEVLRSLENEKPVITRIRTYVNRQQRDPGALKDALDAGGYFFPTNPQSKEEMQNLLFIALKNIIKERNTDIKSLLNDELILTTLESIDCTIKGDVIMVHRGVESGIYGLMLPYVIMMEEFFKFKMGNAVSTWNQASIGAAFAAATLADTILRNPQDIEDSVRSEFNSLFPKISAFIDNEAIGKSVDTRVHGVFDLANLQSLAQLLGVVVLNHLSGRGTAFVGLGSSSYSNGNRCFEILSDSIENNGSFKGKSAFHPATHSINPFAQALIYGEDLVRYLLSLEGFKAKKFDDKSVGQDVLKYVHKPEPAGAAALAGFLLTRLDQKTLSLMEIAYVLKIMGFSQRLFLQFTFGKSEGGGVRKIIQEANEEGKLMGELTKNLLLLMEWTLHDLEEKMASEKSISLKNYQNKQMDDSGFDDRNGPTMIYLTGDNCRQPELNLVLQMAENIFNNKKRLKSFVKTYSGFKD